MRGATLVGNGLEALRRDRRHRRRPRHRDRLSAARAARRVPAGVGQPHVRHPRADRGRDRGVNLEDAARTWPSRPPIVGRRDRRRGVGRGVPRAGACASTTGEVESLSDAGGRGRGRARLRRRPLRLRLRHRPLRRAACAELAPSRARGRRGGRRGRVRRACRTSSAAPTWTASPRPSSPTGPPSARSSWRSRWSARRAAREGVTQVENAVYSDADGARRARQLARLRGLVRGDAGVGLRVRLRGRGRRPDDRPRAWAWARDPGELDPEAIGAEAAERALALVGARQPESRRCPVVLDAFVAASFIGFIGSMLSADAVQRGRSLFAGTRGRGGGRRRAARSPTTAPTATAPRARPSTARASPHAPRRR